MDFKGQRLSEILCMYTIVLFAAIGFVSGYIMGSFRLTMIIYFAGVILAFVISVPDWPYFNQNPLEWLSSRQAEASWSSAVVATRSSSKKSRK